MTPPTVAVRCEGVDKSFGATHAVKDLSLDIREGSMHALVGENGAGKSTVLGIISGRVTPDRGSVSVFGEQIRGGHPTDLRNAGIATIYQELTMVPALSAEENVFLGHLPTRRGLLDLRSRRRRFLEICEDFGLNIPPDVSARELSVSQQQMVEIMRGVAAQARVLLLDEPSAALAERERETLHQLLLTLQRRGSTIVFVSHNLDEVLELADRITVMRDGTLVADADAGNWTKRSLINRMVGHDVDFDERQSTRTDDLVAKITDVRARPHAHPISVEIRRGEIVGLWGLVGSGRTSFLKALAGLMPASTGVLEIDGQKAVWPRSPGDSQALGIALLPEDRRQGLVMQMDTVDNHWIGRHGRYVPARINRGREEEVVKDAAPRFGFAPSRVRHPVGQLSGGNQQKALLSKWAARNPRLFLVDEPTRGIDVGAKAEVLTSLGRLAGDGAGVVVTSSELEEVLGVCDRVLVFSEGSVVGEVPRGGAGFSVESILQLGFRAGEEGTP